MIGEEEFVAILRGVSWESYIGYEATATHLQQISGMYVPISREQIRLNDGDVMLVCRLKYRLTDPKAKRDRDFVPDRGEYEYLVVTYKAES